MRGRWLAEDADLTLRDGVNAVAILFGLVATIAVGTGAVVGYRWFNTYYSVSVDHDGAARPKVITATLFNRDDLRVAELTGSVQGAANARRWWGWLNSSQVVKAPFSVTYSLPLRHMRLSDFRYDRSTRVLFVRAPDPVADKPNIDLAQVTLNDVQGAFVSRGAMVEMSAKVAASARDAAIEKAGSVEYRERVRAFAREDLKRLFEGVLKATGMAARVEVRFAGESMPSDVERWDVSRTPAEVLGR